MYEVTLYRLLFIFNHIFFLFLFCFVSVPQRPCDRQLSEVVLSFHHVGPGVKLMFLAARARCHFTKPSSYLATFSRTNSLFPRVAAAVLPSPECTVPSAHLHASSLLNCSHCSGNVSALTCMLDWHNHLVLCYRRSFVTVALSPCKMHGDLKTFRLRLC